MKVKTNIKAGRGGRGRKHPEDNGVHTQPHA